MSKVTGFPLTALIDQHTADLLGWVEFGWRRKYLLLRFYS